MEFKKGDVVICVEEFESNCGGKIYKLEFGRRYIIRECNGDGYVSIKKHQDEIYDDKMASLGTSYYAYRFIHEDDWIRRIKHGV